MNDKLPVVAAALCMLLSSKMAFSQSPADVVLKPGAKGIYINLSNRAFFPKNGSTDIIAFEIERKAAKEGSYTKLATVQFPDNAAAFRNALEAAFRQCPYEVRQQSYPAEIIWNSLRSSGGKIDSGFRAWSGYLPVRLAAGMTYLDATALKNTDYRYRISYIDNRGTTHLMIETAAAQYPHPLKLSRPQLQLATWADSACQLSWYMKGTGTGQYRLLRQDQQNGPFNAILKAGFSFTYKKDTVSITARDSTAIKGSLYYYKLIPADAWGNESTASDAFCVPVYNFRQVGLPSSINIAINDTGVAGIAISWKLPDTLHVKDVLLYRADTENGRDSLIKTFTSHSTRFTDNNGIIPMHYYYYRFAIRGYFNEISVKTIAFAGQYISGVRPSPPVISKAGIVPGGIELQFRAVSGNITGFKVFRSSDAGRPLLQVSDFIPFKKEGLRFLDTAVSGGGIYGYAIQSISTSHINGPFSDTVYVRSNKPPAITTLNRARVVASARGNEIFWDDLRTPDNPIMAYSVYRRMTGSSNQGANWKKINERPIAATEKHYHDAGAGTNDHYEYLVKAMYAIGTEQPISTIIKVQGNAAAADLPLLSPQDLKAYATEQGVQLEWTMPGDTRVTSFCVYRYTRGKPAVQLAQVKQATIFLDKSATRGLLYFYYVTGADDRKRESKAENEVSVYLE